MLEGDVPTRGEIERARAARELVAAADAVKTAANATSDAAIGLAFLQAVFGDQFDWNSEHFARTPERFVKMLRELTTPEESNFTAFESDVDEMVVVRDITFTAMCAHHIVPFMGVCHIGYVPNGKIAGLSKFARLVRYFAKDLTVQEELTQKILTRVVGELGAKGVIVIMEAEHLCMTIRGVQSPGTKTVTSAVFGVFAEHDRLARQEFLSLIKE
jgi:GTP cyclohydrolase I